MFTQWALTGFFDVDVEDENILTESALKNLFTTAGRLTGLGDWRPSSPRPGQYGRFIAEVARVG